jgi:hypothetical protein
LAYESISHNQRGRELKTTISSKNRNPVRTVEMLAAIAAIVMAVGTVSATVSVTENDHVVGKQFDEPVVEVQTVERSGFLSE